MARWSLLLLASGCYITLDKASEEEDSDGVIEEPGIPEPPPPHEDVIVQDVASVVDVLFVVQDDPEAQDTFRESLPNFFDFLLGSGLDWHVGFVASGTDDPATSGVLLDLGGQLWLDTDTPDIFSHMSWSLPGGPSQPRQVVYDALATQGDLANLGFFRDEAPLTVAVVSDGEDVSTALTETEFVDWLVADRTAGVTWSCVLAGEGTACGSTSALLSGLTGDVADPELYQDLGLLAVGLTQTFPLSQLPVAETIAVTVEEMGATFAFEPIELDVEGNVVAGDWAYDPTSNSITFVEYIPSNGAEVHITYEIAAR